MPTEVKKGLLTVDQAAELLGLKASTIRAWLSRRKLPRVNCGRAVRIPAESILEFIEQNTIPARKPSDVAIERGKWDVEDKEILLPNVSPIPGVAPRIFDTYKPILAVAQICEDVEFMRQIEERLKLETLQLKQDQSFEPDALVLRAYIGCLTVDALGIGKGKLDFRHNVKVGDIADAVWKNEKESITPRQAASTLRDLGFKTKESHGVTVVQPDPVVLVRACDECNYEDDSILTLRKELLSGGTGRDGRHIPSLSPQPGATPHKGRKPTFSTRSTQSIPTGTA